MSIGIVVALPEEVATLTSSKLRKGQIHRLNEKISIAYSGAGRANADRAARLLADSGSTALVSWGCAAGLSQGLKPGDLVIASECVSADGKVITISGAWRQGLIAKLGIASIPVQTGKLAESRRVVSSSEAKAELAENTGAIALDMESAAIAEVAQAGKLPFLIIRAIADPVTMALPGAVRAALNEQGDVVMLSLLRHLLFHPGELPELVRLGQCFNAARKTLNKVTEHLDAIATASLQLTEQE